MNSKKLPLTANKARFLRRRYKVLTTLLYDRGASLEAFEHMVLRNAVATENNEFIAFVLTQGIDADSRFENEQTALMTAARNACESGNLNTMRMLLA